MGLACTMGLTVLSSLEWQAPNEKWYQYFTPNVGPVSYTHLPGAKRPYLGKYSSVYRVHAPVRGSMAAAPVTPRT